MRRSITNAFAATALAGLSLYLWRLSYIYSDWAILALAPLAVGIWIGFWPLTLSPWRAWLHVALRRESPLGRILQGNVRAFLVTAGFTCIAVTLLAWQALDASVVDASIMLVAFFLSAGLFSRGQRYLARHFHEPFARGLATSLVSWSVALPLILVIALTTWTSTPMPHEMLQADFVEAVQIGLSNLPERGGWIAGFLSIPYGYEAIKLWAVVQLRDYPIFSALFSLDVALFSFVLCRSAVILNQFIDTHILKVAE